MVAVDSSTLIAHFQDDQGPDVAALKAALIAGDVVLPPVVLVEILSEPRLPGHHRAIMLAIPLLELRPDYSVRAAATRSTVLGRGLRARLPDTHRAVMHRP